MIVVQRLEYAKLAVKSSNNFQLPVIRWPRGYSIRNDSAEKLRRRAGPGLPGEEFSAKNVRQA